MSLKQVGLRRSTIRGLSAYSKRKISLPCLSLVAHYFTEVQLLIGDRYLMHIRALLHYPTGYDFTQTQTYLEALGLNIGLVVNFGRKQLQIYGIKAG